MLFNNMSYCYSIVPYQSALQLEALKGHRVVDVACGSGDAQTLCITDDDNVWSWGDGDYGKLGKHLASF